jgi:predicted nucleic acid-binding protein
LATALVGKADFLITNDKDLLEIAEADKKKFKFRIVSPIEFLKAIGE